MSKQFRITIDSSDPEIAEKLETILTYEFPDSKITRFSIQEVPQLAPHIPLVIGNIEKPMDMLSLPMELLKFEPEPILCAGPVPQHVGKENHIERAIRVLSHIGIPYQVFNSNMHFIVEYRGKVIDYWPTTGKWRDRQLFISKRGFKEMLRHLGVPKNVY